MRLKFYLRLATVSVLLLCICNYTFAQNETQTEKQIQKLIEEKESRSPAESKISSQLLQAVREARGQKMADGVDLAPANVHADAAGGLKVDINAVVTDALLNKIKALGGKIIFSSQQFHSIRASIKLTSVETIAGYPEVRLIKPAAVAHTVSDNGPTFLSGKTGGKGHSLVNGPFNNTTKLAHIEQKRRSFQERAAKVKQQLQQYLLTFGSGSVNSEGDHSHGADDTRKAYGYEGQGIRIGILSDSYDATGGAAADITSGDLPGVGNPLGNTLPVTVLEDYGGGSDEGRAMLQIVHDLAPKAQLYFATAFLSEADFASNILALRGSPNKCDIIVDDIFYYDEPVYQDGIIAQAINTVTADGALYFSAAGNEGSLLMNTSGVFEGDFTDVGSPVFTGDKKKGTIHNFGTATAPVSGDSIMEQGFYFTLNWADPLGASSDDYDLFVVNKKGAVKASSTDIQNGTQDPFEGFSYTMTPGDKLVVFKTNKAEARAFSINTIRGTLKYATTGQTHGHSSATAAFSVAATPANLSQRFTKSAEVEYFSSDGPRRMFFNADTTPVTAGNFLFGTNGGVVRQKPDITAADGVSTTLPSSSGLNPFYGTSAAAPHAGAIAALLKSAQPTITTTQMRTLLTTTALDIEAKGYDINSGYGIVQAFQAMKSLNPTPLADIITGTVKATEGQFSNHNGALDPGEVSNLTIALKNPSLGNATKVSAILTTSTPGVTVTQDSAFYGSIAAGKTVINTAMPFTFAVNSSVACGAIIHFTVKTSFEGGISPKIYMFTVTVGSNVFTNISSALGTTPPTDTSYTAVSGQQTGRITRGSDTSSCAKTLANPGIFDNTGLRQFDAYTFTNTTADDKCVIVSVNSDNGINLYSVAYSDAGFNPADPSANFVAEPGPSGNLMQYSFTVPAGKKYTVVVHDVSVLPTSSSSYTLNVSYSNCAVGPKCKPVKVTTPPLAVGATGVAYKQVLTASGGSGTGVFMFAITGGLPAGLTLAGDSLFGTPTQAGHFPVNIIASDPAGCAPASKKDTLVITGIAPASIAAISGTPQKAIPGHDFAKPLTVTVYDNTSTPLSGVNVMFTAPESGASGTFAGGSTSVILVTDGSGTVVSPVFTANSVAGSYTVTATVTGVAAPANFLLSNVCISTVVTSGADKGAGSLRYMVENACAGSTITFAPGISVINLTSGELDILHSISIVGPGADKLTINGSYNSRIFFVGADTADVVNISGVKMSEGLPDASNLDGGGAVLIYSGKLNIKNCDMSGNDASFTYFAEGGGVDNEGGVVTIDNCSITNNTAYYDGGGVTAYFGSTSISNSTIAGNKVASSGGTAGGGVYAYQSTSITNCTIYGNKAQFGGNVLNYPNTSIPNKLTLKNTIIAGGKLIGTGGSGPDVWGKDFVSADYNLIQDTSSAIIKGPSKHNIIGVAANLLPLANYGGTMPTMLPLPNSAAVNAGDKALLPTQFDERGFTRVVAGVADIGAVEANYQSVTSAGTPQSAVINKKFAVALQGTVTESGNPIKGVSVMFTAPATGASGTFNGGATTATVVTKDGGIATAPAFTANGNTGTYTVTDSIGAAFANTGFILTNTSLLPVTFGRINATTVNCTAQITWETLTEVNSKTFTLEYSADATKYSELYTTPGKGYSTTKQVYSYTHETPAEGANYYRIKETDLDGAVTYSSGIIVINNCSNSAIVAYPNPAHSTLSIVIPGTAKQTVSVYDANGRRITGYASVTGKQDINVSQWASGVYTLVVTKDGKTSYTLKVFKN